MKNHSEIMSADVSNVMRGKLRLSHRLVFLAHALVGWALCGAVIGIGRNLMSMETTLIVHAIAAPIIFAVTSSIYFKTFAYTSPLTTALLFTFIIITLDLFVIAALVEKSLEMFASILGTWIPFGLIFLSTYVAGLTVANPGRGSGVNAIRDRLE